MHLLNWYEIGFLVNLQNDFLRIFTFFNFKLKFSTRWNLWLSFVHMIESLCAQCDRRDNNLTKKKINGRTQSLVC